MSPAITGLLREAAEWRLLSILFEYPGAGWRDRLTGIASDMCDDALGAAANAALTEASAGMHHSIFGPGGPVSPREASYTNGVQLGYLLAEISAFYNAFAYTPEGAEPVDHISVEAGFVAYMRLKQAYALTCGEDEKASIAADATEDFMREHLARMGSRIAARVDPIAPPYLVAASAILANRCGPAPIELGVLSDPSADEEAAGCGSNDEVTAVEPPSALFAK